MSLISISVDVSGFTGPLLDGSHEAVVADWEQDMLDSVARQGLSEIGLQMDIFFRNPTPFYETQVRWDVEGADRVIHDTGIIYGPWLAGTGSRNATSRFKGYPHWRRTEQYLRDGAGGAVERAEADLARRLGGR